MKHWLLAATALTLTACAHSAERRQQAQFTELQRALPGTYISPAAGGAAADAGVSLTVSPVTAQLIGDAVYFVRETPADNAGLVLWQGVWTLAPEAPARHRHAHEAPGIVQHSFLFKDPRRWTSAASNPDLLVSMLPQDLQALPGCDLVWHATAAGFETMDAAGACSPGREASGLWVVQQARLEGSALTLIEHPIDAAGAPDLREAPMTLHLTRTGTPP